VSETDNGWCVWNDFVEAETLTGNQNSVLTVNAVLALNSHTTETWDYEVAGVQSQSEVVTSCGWSELVAYQNVGVVDT
ncbi:hypothetical protein, partial [Mycobacterium tuberculosis]|uniref:hypothetical protein n=1 Tax=Mycobacterium tuberculosis TaxID=1773 RepID=UPI001AE19F3B